MFLAATIMKMVDPLAESLGEILVLPGEMWVAVDDDIWQFSCG